MFQKMWDFKFLPPGRGLYGMGTEALKIKGGMMLNNCSFTSSENIGYDFSAPFTWTMDALALGVGVGFDCLGAGKMTIKKPATNDGSYAFSIPDSREGWVEALRLLLFAFEKGVQIPKYDYSLIRPLGAPIKTLGGTASGPAPLKSMLEDIEKLLMSRVDQKIRSVDIVDIMNFIGKAIVSGNIRRSSELSLGNPDDIDFIECKDPDKYSEELLDRRWASNNSIFATVGMDYSKTVEYIKKNAEPGYFWIENARKFGRMKDPETDSDVAIGGCNPCAEIVLENFELCNLNEIFPARHETVEEFYDTLKYAYLYSKTVTLVPTHDQRTNAVMLRNRRIGTSMSGIEQAKAKFGTRKFYEDFCDKGYEIIKEWDKKYSNWFCVPRSIKLTTCKPAGTTSLLPGATPGVHAAHSEYYFRTMRIAHNSPLVKSLIKAGYRVEYGATEWKSVFEPKIKKPQWVKFVSENSIANFNKPPLDNFEGTVVVYFPVKEKNFSKSKRDQTIWEQMENAAKMQFYWSDNSISTTVSFKPEEVDQIKTALEHYESRLKTVSFMPLDTHGYHQAPYQECTKEEYEEYIKGLKPLDLANVSEPPIGEKYCSNDTCAL
jgi:adenosylcobalamin-dependent ribonucleoside-triphosphate reductase